MKGRNLILWLVALLVLAVVNILAFQLRCEQCRSVSAPTRLADAAG
ncbi:MAG: hypothetical protein ACE5LU_22135 [Anaerolineae bacterium]